MQRRRKKAVLILQKLLTCAICAIALVALLSVHLRIFPPSKVVDFADPYKLPTVVSQNKHEIKYQILSREQSWTRELAPPHLSKAPLSSRKLVDDASQISDFKYLWKPPPNRDYAPCVEPSPNYTSLAESRPRGYLMVNTNGGLNQMRAGE